MTFDEFAPLAEMVVPDQAIIDGFRTYYDEAIIGMTDLGPEPEMAEWQEWFRAYLAGEIDEIEDAMDDGRIE